MKVEYRYKKKWTSKLKIHGVECDASRWITFHDPRYFFSFLFLMVGLGRGSGNRKRIRNLNKLNIIGNEHYHTIDFGATVN